VLDPTRMKREKRLTKRDRKELKGGPNAAGTPQQQHIHCVACGRHLDVEEFGTTATQVKCAHGSMFSSCVGCVVKTTTLLAEHDRTGQPVKTAGAWH
jgi:hypothetical protein